MAANTVPHLDYEMVARYEWFRRGGWSAPEPLVLNPLFIGLLHEYGCTSCLYAGGALGRTALELTRSLNGAVTVTSYQPTGYGAERGREMAKADNLPCTFLSGDRGEIHGNLPHPVDAVFSPNWLSEPEWNILKTYFESAFAALNPGGIIAFPAPFPGHDWGQLLTYFDAWENDTLVWHYRDGARACLCLRSKVARAENYADVKYTYVMVDGSNALVESTVKRLPAYWTWAIAQELAEKSGFVDVAALEFPSEAAGRDSSVLLIARKPGSKPAGSGPAPKPHSDARGELHAYADF